MEHSALDWDNLRFFLAIARHGSLTGAAKELWVAQSTVGCRLASLESSLSARLLHRTLEGYRLTLAGESVRAQAERVEAEALTVQRTVGGQDDRFEGVMRVTCTETLAVHVLAPCFIALQHHHPRNLVELVPNPAEVSLSMREADIAVCLSPSERNEFVVRRMGRMAFGLYASPLYLQRHGEPDFAAGYAVHRLVSSLDDVDGDDQSRWLAELTWRARPGLQTSSHEALMVAARSDGGLARFRADPDPALACWRPQAPRHRPTSDSRCTRTAAARRASGRRRRPSARPLGPCCPGDGSGVRLRIAGRRKSKASGAIGTRYGGDASVTETRVVPGGRDVACE